MLHTFLYRPLAAKVQPPASATLPELCGLLADGYDGFVGWQIRHDPMPCSRLVWAPYSARGMWQQHLTAACPPTQCTVHQCHTEHSTSNSRNRRQASVKGQA